MWIAEIILKPFVEILLMSEYLQKSGVYELWKWTTGMMSWFMQLNELNVAVWSNWRPLHTTTLRLVKCVQFAVSYL